MSPPQFEVDLLAARDAFDEVAAHPASSLRAAGERYVALLDEYLERLRRESRLAPAPWPAQNYAQPGSLGTAPARDLQESLQWAHAERERVEARIAAGEGKGG